jgi:carboxymethylenebutenolidase
MQLADPAAIEPRAFAAREQTWAVETADGGLGVQVRAPGGPGPFPVVVLFHHGPGMDDGTRAVMSTIAARGYLVVAPDRYYRTSPWMHFNVGELLHGDADGEQMKALLTVMADATDDRMAMDLAALLTRLETEPLARGGAMGCVGFCIGARTALRAMADHPDVFVAGALLHPSGCVEPGQDSPHAAVPNSPGHLYVALGSADHMASTEHNAPLMEAVRSLGERGVVEVHEGASHGFAVPGAGYQRPAAQRSYAESLALFDRVLT